MKRILSALLAVLCVGPSVAGEIRVSAAASLTDVLEKAGKEYGRKTGEHIIFNFGASSTLARQIEEGAPADLFISADELKMDGLQRHGSIVPASRRSIASNTLVIVLPVRSRMRIRTANDLLDAKIRHLALAETMAVPAGIYARSYLERLHLWDRLIPKVVPTENVRAALAAVASENADAAIVYRTDALSSRDVRIALEVPKADGPQISYPAAVLAESHRKEAAQQFLDYLRSPEASRIFRQYGFLVN
jgi:molybdate transport system substrate-binding protein